MNFTAETIKELIPFADSFDKTDLYNLLQFLDSEYHNDESVVDDATYDDLVDLYETKYEKYTSIGAEPTDTKVDLPYFLGSLRKLKLDKEITLWSKTYNGPYFIEDKIDGLTLLYTTTFTNDTCTRALYTRGKGHRGKDVSHLLEYLHFPILHETIAIRGEIVMKKEVFEELSLENFQQTGKHLKDARSTVCGLVSKKKNIKEDFLRKLSFYAYKIFSRNETPETDSKDLRSMGFSIPIHSIMESINQKSLSDYLLSRKTLAPYEIDGLVVYQNTAVVYPTDDNPRHIIAFKMLGETSTTVVKEVIWNSSRNRILNPIIIYEPVTLSGAVLQKASGYNARFIVNHCIGPNAKIVITRSGDVIPKVVSVITPSPTGPSLPQQQYHWDETNVEIIGEDDNDQVLTKKLHHFVTTLDIKNAGEGRLALFVDAGIKTIDDLLQVNAERLRSIQGIGDKLSTQFVEELHEKLKAVSLPKIMDASGFFPNIGERRFELIVEAYPNFLGYAYEDKEVIISMIKEVKGFNMLAVDVAENIARFCDWLASHPEIKIKYKEMKVASGDVSLEGKTFVLSGTRDKNLEDIIKLKGGKIGSAISKKTTMLIMKNLEEKKGKAEKAEELKIPIISVEEFLKTWGV